MIHNDILRRLRYALDIKNSTLVEIFKLSDQDITEADVIRLLKKEEDKSYVECSNEQMRAFLDGLIVYKRGPSDKESTVNDVTVTNNIVLKKIRIALELHEDEMISIINLGGINISKSELSALFRREGHKNYKECGDQFLRNFLKGLTEHFRPLLEEGK